MKRNIFLGYVTLVQIQSIKNSKSETKVMKIINYSYLFLWILRQASMIQKMIILSSLICH